MQIDNPFSLLVEAAQDDIMQDTNGWMLESTIEQRLNSIEEISQDFIIPAEAVPVIEVDESYLVEMNAIAGFMISNGVKSIEEALDKLTEANNMPYKSIGLLVESDDQIEGMIEKAKEKFKKDGNKKAKNNILEKIKKSTDITDKLQKDGYKVKKKKSKKKDSKKPSTKAKKSFTGSADTEDEEDDI